MKKFQRSFISGFVELMIQGENPIYFLETCSRNGIRIWDVIRQDEDTCVAKISLEDVKLVKKLRFRSSYKVSFTKKSGLPFIKNRLFSEKALIIGFLLSLSLFVLFSNMIWQVKVNGVPEELEAKIYTQLEKHGIHQWAFKWNIAAPHEIQQLLTEDLSELLWVGVDVAGTTYRLEAVEKQVVKKTEEGAPRHLIASKKGVIQNLFIEKGQANVKVNDVVEKGQLLVSGEIEKKGHVNTEDAESEQYERVRAEGEIRAITWYHVATSLPLEVKHERLSGNKRKTYKLQLGNVRLHLWPWKVTPFEREFVEQEKKQFAINQWKPRLKWIENHIYESYTETKILTEEEAIELAVAQAEADLLLELGLDTEILSGKILHESIDRGKVNLSLYFTVEENIAIGQSIDQGD